MNLTVEKRDDSVHAMHTMKKYVIDTYWQQK
jgi:hypothetical protein